MGAWLFPHKIIQEREKAVKLDLTICPHFFVTEPKKRAVRFENTPELSGHRCHPSAKIVERFPLSVPFVGNDFEVRRVGENEVN